MCSVLLCIFFLGHRITPFVPTVFTGNLYGDMAEPTVLFSLRQCLTLAEIIITLPSCKLTAALPSSRYQPLPAVQSQSCPPPFEAQWICRLLRQPGTKDTLAAKRIPPQGMERRFKPDSRELHGVVSRACGRGWLCNIRHLFGVADFESVVAIGTLLGFYQSNCEYCTQNAVRQR